LIMNRRYYALIMAVALLVASTALAASFSAAPSRATAPPGPAAFPGPNGRIAFISTRDGNAEVYTMNPDGTGLLRLTDTAAAEYEPTWSADGKKIAFRSGRDGNDEIYVMNADGSAQTRLTFDAAADMTPAWSPDGAQIAFVSERDGGNEEIYVMDADGGNQTNLTQSVGHERHPDWHPSEPLIAYDRNDSGHLGIYIMDTDGGNQQPFYGGIPGPGYVAASEPSWSPDGLKLAFVRFIAGNQEISSINVDGSGINDLSWHAANDWYPSWSPDGEQIAFTSDRDGVVAVYTMNSFNGANQTNVTGAGFNYLPDWGMSPVQGGAITIIQHVKPAGTAGPGLWAFAGGLGEFLIQEEGGIKSFNDLPPGIYTITQAKVDDFGQVVNCDSGEFGTLEVTLELDNQETVTCTFRATKVAVGPGPIVFSSNRDGDYDIYLLDPDVRALEPRQLTDAPGDDTDPTLSPDGTQIAFTSERNGDPDVFIMDSDGAFPTPMTQGPAIQRRPAFSTDGEEIAFESDETGNSDIYTMPLISRVPVRVTTNPANDCDPTWVPGPMPRVIYTSDRDGNEELYMEEIGLAGQTRRLTNNPGVDYAPTVGGPTGAYVVAFTCEFLYVPGSLEYGLCKFVLDDNDRITAADPVILTDAPGVNYALDWSLDGTQIRFSSTRDGNAEIYTMTPDGENETRQTDDPAGDGVADPEPLPPGDITIQAVVVGPAPAADRQFGGDLGTFTLPVAGGEKTFSDQPAGSYWVNETLLPGYSSEATCTGGATGGNSVVLTLDPAESVTCTFMLTAEGVVLDNLLYAPAAFR
jgi:Tol biopolymer transport system component